jgi:RND family efflux transporter MFP subunit
MKALETEFAVKFAEVEANEIKEKVAARQANSALARVQELFKKNAKSQRELEEAETAAKTAEANLAAAGEMKKTYLEAKARLASLPQATQFENGFPAVELRAPVSGVVTQVSGTDGEQVAPEKPVFIILDARIVHIEARVPESQLPRISAAKGATYLLPGEKDRHVQVLGESGGRVVYLGLEVDPATRTLPLVYETSNPEGKLRLGMALDVFVETNQAQDALAIPESAIVDEDGKPVAFVQVSGETFQKRELTLGIRDSGFVQVLAGLAEGERVATKGAYSIKLASVSTSIPAHGHAH